MRPLTAFAIAIVLSTIFNGFTCGFKILEPYWKTSVSKLTLSTTVLWYDFKNLYKPICEGMDEDTFREYRLRKIYCFEGEYTINMPKEIVFVFFFKLEYFQKRLFWVKLWLSGRLLAGIAGNLRSHRSFWFRNSFPSLMSFIPANIRQCKNYINCINLSVLMYKKLKEKSFLRESRIDCIPMCKTRWGIW